jgi:hypothetical protein
MKQKASHRITNAIIETTFGKQSWLSGVHPLHKSPCGFCPAMVCEKDVKDHLETFHGQTEDEQTPDLEPMFPEDDSQSESEARNAH